MCANIGFQDCGRGVGGRKESELGAWSRCDIPASVVMHGTPILLYMYIRFVHIIAGFFDSLIFIFQVYISLLPPGIFVLFNFPVKLLLCCSLSIEELSCCVVHYRYKYGAQQFVSCYCRILLLK